MKSFLLIFTSLVLAILVSCERKEKLWPAPKVPVGIQTQIFELGENYENQIWFNIASQKFYMNHHDGWEIAFATDGSNRITINGGRNQRYTVAKFPGAAYDRYTDKSDPDITNLKLFEFDNPSGEADSQVFNDWYTTVSPGSFTGKDVLYVIDRGDDSFGLRRWIKMRLHSRTGGVYHFDWGYLFDTIPTHDVLLPVDENYNFMYYNFTKADTVTNEPCTKDLWDIVFTTYKKSIPDITNPGTMSPYIVRGVISNPDNIQVFDVPNVGLSTWDQVTLDYAKALTYSPALDEIGYDWKIWNMSANKYTMANKIYVIKCTNGTYFKLKFVDFYDDNGRKGYPKMAWELLK